MNPYNTWEQAFAPEKFSTPDPFCYPIYSWVWNDDLTKENIYEQLDFFCGKSNEKFVYSSYFKEISEQYAVTAPT